VNHKICNNLCGTKVEWKAVRGVHVVWPPSTMVGLKTSGEEGGEARRVDLVEQVSDGEIISMMTDGSPPNHFLNAQNAQTP